MVRISMGMRMTMKMSMRIRMRMSMMTRRRRILIMSARMNKMKAVSVPRRVTETTQPQHLLVSCRQTNLEASIASPLPNAVTFVCGQDLLHPHHTTILDLSQVQHTAAHLCFGGLRKLN